MGETYIQATIVSKALRESEAEYPHLIAFRIVGDVREVTKFLGFVKPCYEIKYLLRGDKQ